MWLDRPLQSKFYFIYLALLALWQSIFLILPVDSLTQSQFIFQTTPILQIFHHIGMMFIITDMSWVAPLRVFSKVLHLTTKKNWLTAIISNGIIIAKVVELMDRYVNKYVRFVIFNYLMLFSFLEIVKWNGTLLYNESKWISHLHN